MLRSSQQSEFHITLQPSEVSQDHEDISFDKWLEKTEDEPLPPSLDTIFHPIELNPGHGRPVSPRAVAGGRSPRVLGEHNDRVLSTAEQINEMMESSKLRMENKRLEQQMSRSIDKYERLLRERQDSEKREVHKYRQESDGFRVKFEECKRAQAEEQTRYRSIIQMNQERVASLQKQNQQLRNKLEKQIKEKSKFQSEVSCQSSKLESMQQQLDQLQKKLRVKQKQLKKYQELQQERNSFYQNTFEQKQTAISALKQTISRTNLQMLQSTKQLEGEIQMTKVSLQAIDKQLLWKSELLHSASNAIFSVLRKLSEFIQTNAHQLRSGNSSNFSSINCTGAKEYIKQGDLKKLENLVSQTIQLHSKQAEQYQNEMVAYQQKYTTQIADLDAKTTHLLQENKHLKQTQLSMFKSNSQEQLWSAASLQRSKLYFQEEQKLRENLQQVKKHRHNERYNKSREFADTLSAFHSHKPKIKQEIYNQEATRIKQEAEKARAIYKQASLRSNSTDNLRKSRESLSPTVSRRTRNSLSWKDHKAALMQYL